MINKDNIIYIFLGLYVLDIITTSLGMYLGLVELNPIYNSHLKNILIHLFIGSIIYWYHFKVRDFKGYGLIMTTISTYYLMIFINNFLLILSII